MLRAKAARARKQGIGLRRARAGGHRHRRRARRHPGGRGARQRREPLRPGRALLREGARRRARRTAAGVPRAHRARAAAASWHHRQAREPRRRSQRRTRPPRPPDGGAVRHLLRQSQRARTSTRTWSRCSSTTASRWRCCRRSAAAACRGWNSGTWKRSRSSRKHNIPQLAAAVDAGYDIVAPIPSCVLMFKQELPLMFPDDAAVRKVAERDVRSVRVPDAAPRGGTAAHRLQGRARQGELPRALSPARAEPRPQDARRAAGWCRTPRSRSSSAARATTAPTG